MTIVDAGWRRRPGPERHLAGEPRSAAGSRHDLAGDRGASCAKLVEPAPLDDHLHQQPADGREADRAAQRTGGDRAIDETPSSPLPRAHHGSLSLDERRATEEALKQGELSAVVATASLELGIDMGAVDLVCQVESPGNVARGLQRVGRAGHVVHGTSRGRLIAKTPADLLESAALCRAMLDGRIEHLRVPTGLPRRPGAAGRSPAWRSSRGTSRRCSTWSAAPIRTATSRRRRSRASCGWSRAGSPARDFRDLRARVAWDPIHNRLAALPGTAHLALVGGGTIPDTGQFPVYLGDGGPRLGELDEEFVFERRVGETFMLGNAAWRIDAIEPHRVLVSRAEGQPGGDAVLARRGGVVLARAGRGVGALCREIAGRLDDPELLPWLERECRLEPTAARMLARFLARQQRRRRRDPRRPDDPDRGVPRPGRRARPGRAHAVRRQAAPRAEARPAGADPAAARRDPGLPARRRRAPLPPARTSTSPRSTSSTA